jgi:hypothetical protein
MQLIKPLGFLAGLAVMTACFFPWVYIESAGITVTGLFAKGTNYGKPGLLHLIITFIYLGLLVIPRIWSRRFNLVFATINFGWAVRNFFLISACSGGECPIKKAGLYVTLIGSGFMLLAVLFAPQQGRK